MRKFMLLIAIFIIAINVLTAQRIGHDGVQFAQIIKIDTSMLSETTGTKDDREIYPNSIEISKEEFDEIVSYFLKENPDIVYWIEKSKRTGNMADIGNMGVHIGEVTGTNRELKYMFRSYELGEVIDVSGNPNYYEVYLQAEEAYRYWLQDQKDFAGKDEDLKLNMRRIIFFRYMSNFWVRLNRQ